MKCPDCDNRVAEHGANPILCGRCEGTGKIEVCAFCGADATDDYQGHPSCGKPACELRMQQAMDYHDEAGDR